MGASADKLTGLGAARNRYDIPYADIAKLQVEAMNERFEERKGRIKLLGHRAAEAKISAIQRREDMVPLLFPHTAYKSYPESFLLEQKWDRLIKWLGTISPYPIQPIDVASVRDVDDWIEKLCAVGAFISCSSGTTGKSAMLLASAKDNDWSCIDAVNVFSWGSGVIPAQDRRMMGLAPVAKVPKNEMIGEALERAFCDPARERFRYPAPPITVGSLTKMVVLRKRIADGTITPGELADFEATSKAREAAMAEAVPLSAEALIKVRGERLYVSGMWNALYPVAKAVRDRGFSGKDFHPDNCIYVGGGLKRARLPDDYEQFVLETFNIPTRHKFQNYSMQELNSGMPRCQKGGRYHLPPWVVPLILNKEGDALISQTKGEIEGRAAFFDLSLDGRWGGVISGDKISLDFDPCICGSASPSVRDNIARYADLEGDDKIGCAGTVDAYVRGVA